MFGDEFLDYKAYKQGSKTISSTGRHSTVFGREGDKRLFLSFTGRTQ